MPVFQRLHHRVVELVAVSVLTTAFSFGQAVTPTAPQGSANGAEALPCSRLADAATPVNATVEAKVDGLDSAHLKLGKEIWFKVARGVSYAGCTLEADAVVYARVKSVSSSKDPVAAELSLIFDHADCTGHAKQPLKLRLIAVLGPPDQKHRMHSEMPAEVSGRGRDITDAVAGTNALDMELNPGGPPHTVRPGIVVGVPQLKLEPTAGPECSDKMTSSNSRIQLGPGSEFLLALTELR
jgi:hypothetical protein